MVFRLFGSMRSARLASSALATLAPLAALVALVAVVACSTSSTSTPTPAGDDAGVDPAADGGAEEAVDAAATVPEDAGPDPLVGCTKDPGAPAISVDPSSATDPAGSPSAFTLAKALEGFPAAGGKLYAGIRTEYGGIKCELFESAAPISVANFVGLARGTRPYKNDKGTWRVGHFYDGLLWHRVAPGFVIQGGDPDGLGSGGPGYDLVPENQVDEPLGTLAMAASAQVSGSQFYVVVGTGPKPEYNVFGTCDTPTAIAISNVAHDRTEAPLTEVHMTKVEIARCP